DLAALPPSGLSAILDADPGMMAMLARAAERIGLELDNWYFGVARAGSQGPTPVPFFPEVHDKLTEIGLSSFITLDGGTAWVYTEVLPVEQLVAPQICPSTASSWWGKPHLSALIGSAYATCREAASALHAIALLQVHQAKVTTRKFS
ncbi:hypothetical protein M9458_017255, partial [Cirrhinus mrigala]